MVKLVLGKIGKKGDRGASFSMFWALVAVRALNREIHLELK